MKTIKQIADSLGVDKQRVYRYIRKNNINESHQDAGVMWYDETAEKLIISHFTENNPASRCTSDTNHAASLDMVIAMLKDELDTKNEQIKELNARLSETTAALLAAQQSAQAAQLLHAGTMQDKLSGGNEPAKSFLSRIFRRKG